MTSILGGWRRRIARPLLQSHAPARQMAWGAGIGMFLALLPIVGQLYILPAAWAGCRYLLRRTFHLPMAYAMVLLINPPVKILTFYLYLITGDWLLRDAGYPGMQGGFEEFRLALYGEGGNWIANSVQALQVALSRFGVPIAVGGAVWAVVGSVLAFGATWLAIGYARRRAGRGVAASPVAPAGVD